MGYKVTIRDSWNDKERLLQTANSDVLRLSGDPAVSLDVESIPSFDFAITPGHKEYSNIAALTSLVKVYKPNGAILFEGRVLKPEESMSSSGEVGKSVTCEGLLAFLHDSYQNWGEYHDMSPKDFLQKLIDVHNGQVDDYKKMTLGTVDVTNSTDNVYRYTDDTKDTYDVINEKLIDTLGGELQVRNVNGQLILDYMNVIGSQGEQKIKLSQNMISLTRTTDPTELYSILKPLGATISETSTDSSETSTNKPQKRVMITDVNGGSPYVQNDSLINQIGRVVGTVTWDDVNDPGILLSKAQATIANEQFATESMEISAIDLSLVGKNIDDFTCGNSYEVVNPIIGIDEFKRIVKMSIHLNAPQSSTINVGDRILSQEEYNIQQSKAMNQALTKQVGELNAEVTKISGAFDEQYQEMVKRNAELQAIIDKYGGGDSTTSDINGAIIDVSEFQGSIDWTAVVNAGLALAVIRVQHGSSHEDLTYKANIPGAINAKANYAVYAYNGSVSVVDAKQEATDFYNRAQAVIGSNKQPRFWMIDVEEVTGSDMRSIISAYMDQLNSLGVPDSKIVLYIANQLYDSFNLDVARAGSIWIPSYGKNDGTVAGSTKPNHPYDLWQYTSKGHIAGITQNTVDLSTDPSARFKENYLD